MTDAGTNSVIVADLQKMSVAARIPAGSYPHGLRLALTALPWRRTAPPRT
ncbi:MAG TPA: hypothetical protein VH743_09005 [Beijerinckiaceae bacterium]